MKENAKIITVAGKGGVGKTSVSAAMVKIIAEETGMSPEEVTKGNAHARILFGDTKHPTESE